MSVSVCWSLKGGSGTTVVAAAIALSSPSPTTLVDLDGDLPVALGLADGDGQGVADWLGSDAPAPALGDLLVDVDPTTTLVPCGRICVDRHSERWPELVSWLRARPPAVVDAGTGPPPPTLIVDGVRSILVTRGCYLALRRATHLADRPDGIVLVVEPGRSLGRAEVARAVGAPVLATVSVDPAIARAVDAGLLASRVPRGLQRQLRKLAEPPTRPSRGPAVGRLATLLQP